MDKKYEILEDDFLEIMGDVGKIKVHRIKALRDINKDVKSGDIGGYIESEFNLSQAGECWVYNNAKVFGKSTIQDNATVRDNATVHEFAIVNDMANLYENCDISGNCVVGGNSTIHGNATISGHCTISDFAEIDDFASVSGTSVISGESFVYGSANIRQCYLYDNAEVLGSVIISNDLTLGKDAFVTKSSDYFMLYGVGVNAETLSAYRTESRKIHIFYTGGFTGNIDDFTKFLVDNPTMFGEATTKELKSCISLIIEHMNSNFELDMADTEETDAQNISDDTDDEYSEQDEEFMQNLINTTFGLVSSDMETKVEE